MESYGDSGDVYQVIPDCPAARIQELSIDSGLGFFWHNQPDMQRQALLRIASEPGGRVALAHTSQGIIIGYVTITLPEADTRWGRDQLPGLYEMGGIEVSRDYRGAGLGRALLASVFTPEAYAAEIVIATGYRWCWDVDSARISVREYRCMLERMFGAFGFKIYATDEPNIMWYPDNALVARIGPQVPPELNDKFMGLLFEYQSPGGYFR